MGIKLLSHVCLLLVVSTFVKGSRKAPEPFGKNNPTNLPDSESFDTESAGIVEVYKAQHVVRNLLVPLTGYNDNYDFLITKKCPPIYLNLVDQGKNLGQYVLINETLHKINDGRDAAADNMKTGKDQNVDKSIYIGAADGIYVYDPETRNVVKYGTLTEDILAIDKTIDKDEIYILASDHKIYKVTEQGKVKTQVEGIEYAKDFVLDFLEAIYFIGEDNKPYFLIKGETEPQSFVEFDFEVVNPILGRPMSFEGKGTTSQIHTVPFMVDGVPYLLWNNTVETLIHTKRVPGLTAYNAEYGWVHYYAVNGVIYKQSLFLPKNESDIGEASRNKDSSRKIAFYRDVGADYDNYKKAWRY